MPFIEEDKLAELQNDLESLKLQNEEVKENFAKAEKENNSLGANLKALTMLLVLLAIGLFVFGFLYFQVKKEKESIVLNQEKVMAQKLDSIQANFVPETDDEDYDNIEDLETASPNELIYTIQIGAFKKLDLSKYPEKELKNFRRMPNRDLHTYSIGKFNKVSQAKKFLKEIRRIGIRDAFILPIKNGKRISLKEAIAIENN